MDDRVPEHRDSHASSSHEPSLEPLRSMDLGKHSIYTHFPKDRNCEICQRTKITRAPCRRRIGRVVPRAENFGWFDYSRSQNCQWRMWISKQSSICNRGTRLSYPTDPVVSVQNKNFSGNRKELSKILGADKETQSHLHWQFLGIWQSLWRSFLEPLYVNTSSFRNKWDCWETSTQNKKKVRLLYCCNLVWMRNGGQIPWNATPICGTFKISWLMWRLHKKDALEKLSKDKLTRLVHWLSITLSLRKTSQESINLERKYHLAYSLDTLCTRVELGRVISWLQTLRSWRRWTHRKSMQKDSMQRK